MMMICPSGASHALRKIEEIVLRVSYVVGPNVLKNAQIRLRPKISIV